ncbi:MAG: ATP synthase F1 subunit delta [Absicoccus sp.]|uniref:ATP synthase subunit delta n=1 Tax=Absicoccus intestinalis TaxID=2926319 RepID=A0ABU4WQB8_9FIRM|nr:MULTISPECIES: ATP synthase F1 subunit delta [unclassified Absicoccus]MDX8417672.1 ATP synthase F1 subunit delta [Absicoccus sp. CLA-KB-P134]MDY3035987.1 ATP synthase F1 subunit delta [Absicoccus sp.]
MIDMMPYAQALFEIGIESQKDAIYLDQLKACASVWMSDQELVAVLKHPKIKREQKEQILSACFEKAVDPVVFRYLRVLNQHDLCAYIPEIYQAYKKCYDKYHHIEMVEVYSAASLDAKQVEDLKKVLSKRLHKTVELDVKVDPKLIAGLKVQTADFVLDNTVLARANEMKEQIKKS